MYTTVKTFADSDGSDSGSSSGTMQTWKTNVNISCFNVQISEGIRMRNVCQHLQQQQQEQTPPQQHHEG